MEENGWSSFIFSFSFHFVLMQIDATTEMSQMKCFYERLLVTNCLKMQFKTVFLQFSVMCGYNTGSSTVVCSNDL